ncbi:MAG: (d)CMP kinase [Acidimicrobiia bacterium]
MTDPAPERAPLIIAISGRPGSGKSVVAKRVAAELGLGHVSAGDFMRAMAAERGLSILELSRLAEGDDAIDAEIDARTVWLGTTGESFVIDSRMAWFFLPQSVKVFLDVNTDVAAARIHAALRPTERENVDLETTTRALIGRIESEASRYRRYYRIDYLDTDHYQIVIDTSELSIEAVVTELLRRLQAEPVDREGGSVAL